MEKEFNRDPGCYDYRGDLIKSCRECRGRGYTGTMQNCMFKRDEYRVKAVGDESLPAGAQLIDTGKVYFGFAMSDSMLEGGEDMVLTRRSIDPEEAKYIIENKNNEIVPCLNPSHKPTIEVAKERFGIEIDMPESAPRVKLELGDKAIVMAVSGLPRLGAERHEYTTEEINAESTKITFALWTAVETLFDHDIYLENLNLEESHCVSGNAHRYGNVYDEYWDSHPEYEGRNIGHDLDANMAPSFYTRGCKLTSVDGVNVWVKKDPEES